MSDNSSNNKRIAKNTLLLYGRMIVMMVVNLYASRVILQALGVEDYGIYNVVGGVVAMFSLISGALSSAISRFITFELGKGDITRLKKVFSSSVTIQIILILCIVLLMESAGIWFLNNKMVIPEDRLFAANWVFQLSVLTFAINLWSVPYNAAIIAHEHMSAFAYISLFDSFAKLGIVFLISYSPIDRLIYYALLVALVGMLVRFIYSIYCKRNFAECHYTFIWDKPLIKEMLGFAGWNFIGASSSILRDQGGNIMMNLFFGPAVNAARGISMQVNFAISSFVSNFMTAINPQIIKNYSAGNYEYMFKLVFQGARLSYYILLLIALPVIITTPYLLELWLGVVPDHTVNFTRLVLIFTMSESLAGPLITTVQATGKVRNDQLVVGGIQSLNFPLYYVFLKLGMPPEIVFIIAIALSVCCEMSRLIMLRGLINLRIRDFLHQVYFNVIFTTIIALVLPVILISNITIDSFLVFVLAAFVTLICSVMAIYYCGCNKQERIMVTSWVKSKYVTAKAHIQR